MKSDIAQRSNNATNKPGCLAISPSALVFNEEEGRLWNSEKRVKSFFDTSIATTAVLDKNRKYRSFRTAYRIRRDEVLGSNHAACIPQPEGNLLTAMESAFTDSVTLTASDCGPEWGRTAS